MKIKGFETYDTSGIPYLLRVVLFAAALSVVLIIYMLFFTPMKKEVPNNESDSQTSFLSDTVFTENNPLLIGVNRQYPPLEFTNNKGIPVGFHIDLYKSLMRRAGIKYYKFILGSWSENDRRFKKSEVDLTISMFQLNHMGAEERVGRVNDVNACIVVPNDSPFYTLKDLNDHVIGADSLLCIYENNANVQKENRISYNYDILPHRIQKLKDGKIQALCVEKDVAGYLLNHASYGLQNMRMIDIQSTLQFIMICHNKTPGLLHRLQVAFQEIYADRSLDHMHRRWITNYSADVKRDRSYIYVFFTLSFFVLLLPMGYMLIILSRRHHMMMRSQQNLIMQSLKNMPLPIYIKDPSMDEKILYANPAAIELIGKDGHKVSNFQQKGEGKKRTSEIENEVIRSGKTYFGTAHWVLVDGQELDMQIAKICINYAQKKAIIVVGMVINDLIDARNRSLQAQRMKNAFIASMTKSIRKPLDDIIKYSTALCHSSDDDEQVQELALAKLNKANDSLLHLVNQAMKESERIASYNEEAREWVDLHKIFQAHYDKVILSVENSFKLLEVLFSSPYTEVQAFVARPFVEDFIATIIDVARKLTGEGHLHVYWTVDADNLELYIECSAINYKDEQLAELFIFDSGEIQDNMRGALYYTHSVLKEAGGYMRVVNLLSQGLIFYARIPLQVSHSSIDMHYDYSSIQEIQYTLNKTKIPILTSF